jgi:redox-sensitive bicupin YhaK (pirin superfamily)
MTTHTHNIRRGSERGRTDLGWLKAKHSFSFGRYFNPENMGFGTLRVLNDDVIDPGGGFPEHGHDNMEILTWVLDGALEHRDSLDHREVLRPGELQVMSAGSGIRHSEFNASATEPVHLLQIWIMPATRDVEPRYDQKLFDAADRLNQWDTLASGRGGLKPLVIGQDAELSVADLQEGHALTASIRSGRQGYLHVARGEVTTGEASLVGGDAVSFDPTEELTLTATRDAQLLLFDLG